jgi:stearoyl-CoA 9-desaturase NADPH oxidoreductase
MVSMFHGPKKRTPKPGTAMQPTSSRNPADALLKPILGLLPNFINEHWIDFALAHVSKRVRLVRTLAEVDEVIDETRDIKRFRMRPNRNFKGFIPGQFVPVRIVIDSIVHERYYSVTSEPGDDLLEIAVKRDPLGKVSTWMHDHLSAGDVIELGTAGGEFVLPLPAPERLLFVAGGSGITPIFSLIRSALAEDSDRDIVLLYYARGPEDFAFATALRELAAESPRLVVHYISEVQGSDVRKRLHVRFSGTQLQALAPDFASRQTYLCGPGGLMNAVAAQWEASGCADKLRREVFGVPVVDATDTVAYPITFRRSQQLVENNRPSLLLTAEAAGLRPANGCRMGICHTCVCTKVSGVVRDKLTGAIDSAPDSRIRICVSEPLGPVTLDI